MNIFAGTGTLLVRFPDDFPLEKLTEDRPLYLSPPDFLCDQLLDSVNWLTSRLCFKILTCN